MTHLKPMTVNYSRAEFLSTAIICIACLFFEFFGLTGLVLLMPNEFLLPLKVQIIFLPFDAISVWIFNYAYQIFVCWSAMIFLLGYFYMTLILMNQSCWIVDAAILNAQTVNQKWSSDEINERDVREDIKSIVKDSLEIISWMNETRPILEFSFLAEFTLLSSIFCLCIYTFTSNLNESFYVFVAFLLAFLQISVYCWMGSRFKTKVEMLSTAIYNLPWDEVKPNQRVDLQLVLMMTQNIQGFDGVFKPVDLLTFQSVCHLTKIPFLANIHSTDSRRDLFDADVVENNEYKIIKIFN